MSEIVEVLFKGEVREIFENPGPVILRPGDLVVVQADKGEDMGQVILKGEWVSKKAAEPPLRKVVRKASHKDLEQRAANGAKEIEAFTVCRDRIEERELKMKLVDVDCRFDGSRITFYFTAEKRVDFRELVKDLASVYRTRIELRQIGVRDEAKRLAGFGSCGRKYCCSTFLTEFEPVTLKMAKDQHLSLSPSKISGACGRLMCCLMYEVDAYRKALNSYPRVGSKIKIGDREVQINRVDIFREGVFVNDPEGGEDFIRLDNLPGRSSIGDGPGRSPAGGDDNGDEIGDDDYIGDEYPGDEYSGDEVPDDEVPGGESLGEDDLGGGAEREKAEAQVEARRRNEGKKRRGNRQGRRRSHGGQGRRKGRGGSNQTSNAGGGPRKNKGGGS